MKFFEKIVLVLLLCLSGDLQAQDSTEGWKTRLSIYGWLPDIGGTTRFPSGGSGPPIAVDSSTLVSNLNFTFMGTLDLRKEQWGMFADVLYLDLGDSKSGIRDFSLGPDKIPADVSLDTRFDLKSWIVTMAGTYTLSEADNHLVQWLLGARLMDMDQMLAYSFNGDIGTLPLPGRSNTVSAKLTSWDAITGIKGRFFAGTQQKWFLPFYADLGTGDSSMTWQAMAGVGYTFGWGEALLTWRYLDYDLNDSAIDDINYSGPMLGVSFAW